MERFCNKCGQLVSGDGVFCPNCGGKLDGAVDLGKPTSSVEVMPTVSSNSTNTFGTPGTTNNTYGTTNTTNTTNTTGTYQGQMPSYNQPVYPTNTGMNPQQAEMTTGQWVLTIFLSGLGIIGLILLFVWAFTPDTQPNKRNYARAMLIWQAIALGLVIIYCIGMFACVGAAAGGFEEIFESMEYASISKFFIR